MLTKMNYTCDAHKNELYKNELVMLTQCVFRLVFAYQSNETEKIEHV